MRLPLLTRQVDRRIAAWRESTDAARWPLPDVAPGDCPSVLVLLPTNTCSGRPIGTDALADAAALLVTCGAALTVRLSYSRGYAVDAQSWFIVCQCRVVDEVGLRLALRGAGTRLRHTVTAIELF